jgi:putative flippase GtrA
MAPKQERRIGGRFAAFNLVGLLGVLVQLGCLWILRSMFHLHYIAATVLAVELTILHNFCWHTHWTWGDRPAPTRWLLVRLVRFNLTNGAVSLTGNVLLMALLVEHAQVPLLLANLVSIVLCSSLNFVLSDRIVFASIGCAVVAGVFTDAKPVFAAELRPEAVLAFERYAHLTEARLDREARGESPFLWLDSLDAGERRDTSTRLGRGEVVVSRLETRDGDKRIRFPGSLCHHWLGAMFIPHARLPQVVATMQGYDDYHTLYRPAVRRSTMLSRAEDRFRVYLQLFQKRIVSVVLNTESEVTYTTLSPRRLQVRSNSTRIAEVEHPGASDEREKPIGRDNGFLWRFNNYCSLEESDAGVPGVPGVTVQCETLSLSRDVPIGLGWLIDPFVSGVPRDSLEFTLRALRVALVGGPG